MIAFWSWLAVVIGVVGVGFAFWVHGYRTGLREAMDAAEEVLKRGCCKKEAH